MHRRLKSKPSVGSAVARTTIPLRKSACPLSSAFCIYCECLTIVERCVLRRAKCSSIQHYRRHCRGCCHYPSAPYSVPCATDRTRCNPNSTVHDPDSMTGFVLGADQSRPNQNTVHSLPRPNSSPLSTSYSRCRVKALPTLAQILEIAAIHCKSSIAAQDGQSTTKPQLLVMVVNTRILSCCRIR